MTCLNTCICAGALGLTIAAAALPSSAASIVTYDDRTAFEAAIGAAAQTETFNSYTRDTSFLSPLDVGDFTISTDSTIGGIGPLSTNLIDAAPFIFVALSIDGTPSGQASIRSGETLSFTFDQPIFAFGMNTNILGDGPTVTSFTVSGSTFTPLQDGSPLIFSGVISPTAFSTVSLTYDLAGQGRNRSDTFFFDNITYTTAPVSTVPLPASLPLLAAAPGPSG